MSTTNANASEVPTAGRTANGRFAKGNGGGPGNPFGRKLARFRQLLLDAITDDDIQRVAKLLIEKSLAGDLAAVKLLLQYAIGKPQVVAEPDRVDIDEWELARDRVIPAAEMTERIGAMPITVGILSIDAVSEVQEKEFADRMRHPEKYQDEDDELTAEEWAEELEMMHRARADQGAASEAAGAAGDVGERVAASAGQPAPAASDGPESASANQGRRAQQSAKADARPPLPNGKNGGSRRAAKSAAVVGPEPLRSAG
jgi:hypothetical protein